MLISPLVAELLKYSVVPQSFFPFFFFPGTSQVKMSPLMSSLTSEANSLRSGAEHYILSLKAEEQTHSAISFDTSFDEKVGKQM